MTGAPTPLALLHYVGVRVGKWASVQFLIKPVTRDHMAWFLTTGKKHPVVCTLVAIALGTLARLALSPLVDSIRAPFLTGWPTCLIVALMCGRRYGFVTVLWFGFFGWVVYLETPFKVTHISEVASTTNLVVFLLTSSANVYVVTWLADARDHHELIAHELKHRTNNLISVVQAIVSKTVSDPAQQSALNDRLQAIARAEYLVADQFDKAEVAVLIRDAVSGFANTNMAIDVAPGLYVEARSALYLRLLLHEWATNSTKHGALRPCQRDTAAVTVSLRRLDGHAKMRWIESSVSNIKPFQQNGFGTTLANQLARALDGTAHCNLAPDGIHCELCFHPSYLIDQA